MYKFVYVLKMAESIVSLIGQSTCVWKYFIFKKDFSDKSKHAVCKLCNVSVTHGGGITNLRNRLCLNHSSEYLLLYSPEENNNSVKVDMTQNRMEDFVIVQKIPATLTQAKMLTATVADFISKDMRLISVVDGQGFLNLMHVAEPRYVHGAM